jgi:hypothetical protein
VSGEAWAIVGVVVGSVLGGGAQIVSDILRGKAERRRWIDDHRRIAYLGVLEAIEQLTQALISDTLDGRNPDHPEATSDVANREYYRRRHTVTFYGSPRVVELLDKVEAAITSDAYAASFSEKRTDIIREMNRIVRPRVKALSAAMREELGIVGEGTWP